jgi:hypothetical protein
MEHSSGSCPEELPCIEVSLNAKTSASFIMHLFTLVACPLRALKNRTREFEIVTITLLEIIGKQKREELTCTCVCGDIILSSIFYVRLNIRNL